ncbi:MAG: methyltransferase domain-containing protein [Polaromonas sp.]|uniref:class I SAM-dependent methyltransferase n=1 Tax=Polaromonas sp. TaxID=1869339 RepID=UPI00273032E1|nr:methyltransferase domain-containing protein [Polaromonas sp.]MDP2257742.1 methyltransferase domain-containing protein [Polaromonas sp.]MDP3707709.1 methyltransferase domain-containing protein [Polaromonas sp.]
MSSQIIGLTDWLKTPPGAYLLRWERAHFAEAVSDIFGYHALQLGLPELDALEANRMPHKWLALASAPPAAAQSFLSESKGSPTGTIAVSSPRAALVTDSGALPFPESSLDLVVLPHTLELGGDPHATLREVERVLVPEGRVVISGLNPTSLWGLRQRRGRIYQRWGCEDLFLPRTGEFIGYWRLRDWLRLLNFEVESGRFGCYRPALTSPKWLDRFEWMDSAGERWWPIFGAVYFLVAVKRVRGVRLLEPGWKTHKATAAAPAAVANKDAATRSQP